MVNISKDELLRLDIIGSGNFGVVYKKDDKAYKVYKDLVKANGYDLVENPMLKHEFLTIRKCNRLIRLNRRIQNTDLIEELLYIDGKFSGVVMPFYNGKLFLELRDLPLEERIKYSRILLSNAKELIDNSIYPLDYKLTNMFLVDREVRIIDLDDVLTKVMAFKSPMHAKDSFMILDETIKTFLNDFSSHFFPQEIKERITRKRKEWNKSYVTISSYIDEKSVKNRLLFIDEDFDLSDDRLLDGSRVIIVYENFDKERMIELLNELNSRGISVYDLIERKELDRFINDNCYSECLLTQKNQVLRLK